ncbi:UDP-glucose 4-epimerase [Microbacterium sp. SORGH_AS 1204]|uniref:NAD-dependent epimerase/dehydratase family protein n=1 Tax=Microbacterium sp. SORGH_AS_1204 TaxID=3041785 RepID=UPI00279066DE|nr:NAD-dependent epimerase/dehydratase family protein [Microbacterium sp. SORGH_AS_1204]MDQ1135689.1 UDP-glucose 4-epimerase [Microbacterium sp. SORGH_AS_1204]
MARCLVIGANGFLGSRLTDALVTTGHEVTAFDRFSRGTRAFSSTDLTVVTGDFLSVADLASVVGGHDIVFHFLSTTTPATVDGDPTIDLRTNVAQSVELLALCARAGIRRFFYASSGGAIYGPRPGTRFVEDAAVAPVSPYGIGKLAVERYIDYYAATAGLSAVSLRISNPYGANPNPSKRQGVIPITLNRILRAETVVQVGDGSMVRDYIHVDDLVRRILRMVDAEPRHRVYNLGSGRGTSVTEVLETVRGVVGRDFAVRTTPKPPTFVDHVVLDVTRFSDEFGTDDDLSLTEGIARTWMEMTTA